MAPSLLVLLGLCFLPARSSEACAASRRPGPGRVALSAVAVHEQLSRGVAASALFALSVPSCCVRVIYGLSMTGITALFALYCLNYIVQSFYFEPIF